MLFLYPMDLREMADLLEFRVSGDDGGGVVHRAGQDEAVAVGDAVFGLVLGGLEDQVIGRRKNGEIHPVNVPEHLDLPLVAVLALGGIDDLAQIDRAEIFDPAPARGGPEPSFNGGRSRLSLEKFEKGIAVEDESGCHAKSFLRSFSSFLAREGLLGRKPVTWDTRHFHKPLVRESVRFKIMTPGEFLEEFRRSLPDES